MRNALFLVGLAALPGMANAALVDRHSGQPFRPWNTELRLSAVAINAVGLNAQAVSVGQGNYVRNSIGMVNGGATHKGKLSINAVGTGTQAVAIGSGNTATNDIGTIGGW